MININLLHSDSWTVSFSNMPSLSGVADLAVFDLFVKSITIPEYTMEEIYSDFQTFRVRHQVAPKANKDLSQISIEFKASEDLYNYLTLFEFMRSIKYCELDEDYEGLLRKYTIKSIILNILDNQKRNIATLRFTEAFLLSLGSLSLTTGSADELTFSCNFSYEEILYSRKSIYVGTC